MTLVKIGLLGSGRIAQSVHLPILQRLSKVKVVALAEIDVDLRRHALTLAPGAIGFDHYEELLDLPGLDAVIICLPTALHAHAASAALGRGKHVYLEKPVAANLADATRILNVWEHTNLVGMIGFNYRFNRLYRSMRHHIRHGQIGYVVGARSVFSTPMRELPKWKLARENGGGALLDLGSHHMDLIPYLLGEEVREVYATVESRRSDADTATVQLKLANRSTVQCCFFMNSVEEDRFEIYGERGKLSVDRYLSWDVEIYGPTLERIRAKRLWQGMRSCVRSPHLLNKVRAPAYEPSYQTALAHFVDAVRRNQSVAPDFLDGYRSLALVEAAEESAKTGRTVALRGAPPKQRLSQGSTLDVSDRNDQESLKGVRSALTP